MKIYNSTPKSLTALFSVIGLAAFLLSSCAKPSNNYVNNPAIAAVAFIQASPDEPPVDFFFTNIKVNNVAIAYGQSFDYITVNAGKDPINFVNDISLKTIAADTPQFNQNTRYSLFLVNKVTSPQIFLITDTLLTPASGSASVRFINLSPDAGPVDLVIKNGATVTANKSFKGFSSFSSIPGNVQYTFEVHQAGTATVLATVGFKFNSNFVYTVWFHGLAAGTPGTDGLAADVFTNGFF